MKDSRDEAPLHSGRRLPVLRALAAGDEPPKPLVKGLKDPASVVVGPGGKVFVSIAGETSKEGGAVVAIEEDKAVPFAAVADNLRGLAAYQQLLFVAGRKRVWRIDKTGLADILVAPNGFPTEPQSLADVAVDQESGMLYVSDSGDAEGKGWAVYRVTPLGLPSIVLDAKRLPTMHRPTALAMDGASHLLVGDAGSGELYRVKLADDSTEKIADGLGDVAGLAWDHHGRLFVTDAEGGRLLVFPRPGDKPIVAAKGFRGAADICIDPTGKQLLIADRKAGTLTAVAAAVPGAEVDEPPLPVETTYRLSRSAMDRLARRDGRRQAEPAAADRPDARRRRQRPRLRRHGAGRHSRLSQRPEGDENEDLPRHPRPRLLRRQDQRGGLPRPGVPSEVQGERRVLRLLHHQKGEADQRRVALPRQQGRPQPSRPRIRGRATADLANPTGTTTAARSASARTATSTSRTATAAPATTRTTTARTSSTLLGKILAHRRRSQGRRARTTPSPRTTRSWTGPTPAPRSGPTACATSGGCRSTARRASCGPATWARTCTRRST